MFICEKENTGSLSSRVMFQIIDSQTILSSSSIVVQDKKVSIFSVSINHSISHYIRCRFFSSSYSKVCRQMSQMDTVWYKKTGRRFISVMLPAFNGVAS